jgi:Zn-dependent M28 family amino/carboxypeptidase
MLKRHAAALAALAAAGAPWICAQTPARFSGASALEFTRHAVAFGPRPPGSAAIKKLQAYIESQLKSDRCQVTADEFTGQTPDGPIAMKNIIARFPGAPGRAIVITGHYDTKKMPGENFVGANDGGSSTGFLLEMARALAARPRRSDIYLVWFDGEEAFGQWSATNGIYGSRHLAAKWAADGTLARVKALINVDMIGDKDLGILYDANSAASLRELVWRTAGELGLSQYFLREPSAIEDDHVPFLRQGVTALDLIDFSYGPDNAWWHTADDTMDKLSARSLEIVGNVLVETLNRLDR